MFIVWFVACAGFASEMLDLSGSWRFQLPGSVQEQGFGDEIKKDMQWALSRPEGYSEKSFLEKRQGNVYMKKNVIFLIVFLAVVHSVCGFVFSITGTEKIIWSDEWRFKLDHLEVGITAISMTAPLIFDTSGAPFEYFFEEISGNSGGTDSEWQTSASYLDSDLALNTQYSYIVKMRDTSGAIIVVSEPQNAMTLGLGSAPDFNQPEIMGQLPVRISDDFNPNSGYVIYNAIVTEYGAKQEAAYDNTTAFQAALDAVYENGGGTVFVPSGSWRLDGSLAIPDGVTLCGRWNEPNPVGVTETLLLVYDGRGTTSGSFIEIGESAGVQNLSFYYPEQTLANVAPYPPTIFDPNGSAASAVNLTLYNPYTGIMITEPGGLDTTELCMVHDVFMSPLSMGIVRSRVSDVPRIYRVNIGAQYWGYQDTTVSESAVASHMRANTTGISYGWQSIINLNGATIEDCKDGVLLTEVPGWKIDQFVYQSPAQSAITGCLITNCVTGINIDKVTERFDVFNCTINADTPLRIAYRGIISLNNCNLSGIDTLIKKESDSSPNVQTVLSCYETVFTRSTSVSPVVDFTDGTVELVNCAFGSGPHLQVDLDVTGVRLAGNTQSGSFETLGSIADPSRYLEQSTASLPVIPIEVRQGYSFPEVRMPGTNAMANVRDFGALGDGVNNDTSAFSNALASLPSGGTVYVPPGAYALEEPIVIPAGVELRGSFAEVHRTEDVFGSVIYVRQAAAPCMQVEENAGIRGVSFYYPDQKQVGPFDGYESSIKIIGKDAWVKDATSVNAYKFIDSASHSDTSGHLLSGIWAQC